MGLALTGLLTSQGATINMATPRTPATPQPTRPAMDEWGVYDPQQAGLSALFARLDDRPKTPDAAAPKAAKPKEETPVDPKRPSLGDAT